MISISSWSILKSILSGAIVAWPLYALIGIVIIVKFAFHLREKKRLSESGIAEIDNMDGFFIYI